MECLVDFLIVILEKPLNISIQNAGKTVVKSKVSLEEWNFAKLHLQVMMNFFRSVQVRMLEQKWVPGRAARLFRNQEILSPALHSLSRP